MSVIVMFKEGKIQNIFHGIFIALMYEYKVNISTYVCGFMMIYCQFMRVQLNITPSETVSSFNYIPLQFILQCILFYFVKYLSFYFLAYFINNVMCMSLDFITALKSLKLNIQI